MSSLGISAKRDAANLLNGQVALSALCPGAAYAFTHVEDGKYSFIGYSYGRNNEYVLMITVSPDRIGVTQSWSSHNS